jgi:hypothetical protein
MFSVNKNAPLTVRTTDTNSTFCYSGKNRVAIGFFEEVAAFSRITKRLNGVTVTIRPSRSASQEQTGKKTKNFGNTLHKDEPQVDVSRL